MNTASNRSDKPTMESRRLEPEEYQFDTRVSEEFPLWRRWRVTIMCACQTDVVFGCGETRTAAMERAQRELKEHGRKPAKDKYTANGLAIYVERMVIWHSNGSARYIDEEDFPDHLKGNHR